MSSAYLGPPGSGAKPASLPAPAMTAERAEALVVEYRELFAFYDRDHDGRLSTAETGEAVRALGHAPTDAQLAALQKTVERVYPGGLTFANFIKVLGTIVEPKVPRTSDMATPIVAGLRAFEGVCRGKYDGTISKKDLGVFAGRMGDALSDEDVERLMRFVGYGSSAPTAEIDYKALTATLMTAARAAKS